MVEAIYRECTVQRSVKCVHFMFAFEMMMCVEHRMLNVITPCLFFLNNIDDLRPVDSRDLDINWLVFLSFCFSPSAQWQLLHIRPFPSFLLELRSPWHYHLPSFWNAYFKISFTEGHLYKLILMKMSYFPSFLVDTLIGTHVYNFLSVYQIPQPNFKVSTVSDESPVPLELSVFLSVCFKKISSSEFLWHIVCVLLNFWILCIWEPDLYFI